MASDEAASPVTVLAVGTRKGLWLGTSSDRQNFTFTGPHFLMSEVASVAIDTRSRAGDPATDPGTGGSAGVDSQKGGPAGAGIRILAGVRNEHWGPTVAHSDDLGATWTEQDRAPIAFPPETGAALERIWQLQPDSADRPGVVWAGCEPISVWKSTDGGEHFELNRGLWDHPHRSQWGAGYGGAAAHTVLPSPADADTVHVAMSTGGVYRSTDAGAGWEPRNQGISAYFLPDPQPEFGQCVHKVARDPNDASVLYAQNHHGVYRTDNGGDEWTSIADGLPTDFGFTVLTHPRRSGTAWVIPVMADGERIPPHGHLAVHRTDDGGRTWAQLDAGLAQPEYNVVVRDGAAVDTAEPAGIYFGTRGGTVYASADEGEHFREVLSHLPDVLCVRAAVVGA